MKPQWAVVQPEGRFEHRPMEEQDITWPVVAQAGPTQRMWASAVGADS